MLVLARKVGEKIIIGDEIEVKVVRIGPSTVRLGIVAPGLSIHREEVFVEIQEAKQQEEQNEKERPEGTAREGESPPC